MICGTVLDCLQVGLWREAQEVMQKLRDDGVQPNTVAYNALIKALGTGGQWEEVCQHHAALSLNGLGCAVI